MKYKIGVMGSSKDPSDKLLIRKVRNLGKAIADNNCILLNGATSGMPDEAARGAKSVGGEVIGVSPAMDMEDHVNNYKLPIKYYDSIIYTGFGFNLRNIINIRSSDAVCFVRGSIGTLNEFTIAYEDGKIIGVLEHMGGVSVMFDEIVDICKKDTHAIVVYESDPEKLVKKMLSLIRKKRVKKSKYKE